MVDPPERRVAEWPEEAFRSVRATYWGMIPEVDRQIARLVEGLKAAGAWDDTVIALTSDHGEMTGDQSTPGTFGYDRKSVVQGERVSVRVDRGGRRIIKKK